MASVSLLSPPLRYTEIRVHKLYLTGGGGGEVASVSLLSPPLRYIEIRVHMLDLTEEGGGLRSHYSVHP